MPEKKANQPLMMRRDYDTSEATMLKPVVPPQYTPEEIIENSGSMSVPSIPKGFKLICPACEATGTYMPDEDVTEEDVISCPKCACNIPLSSFSKTASGEYKVINASSHVSYLDPNFKAIRDILPRRAEEVTLSKSETSNLLKHIDRLENIYRKVQKVLKGK